MHEADIAAVALAVLTGSADADLVDVLAARPFASAVAGPQLMTGATRLPSGTLAELDRRKGYLRTVYVIGSTRSVSDGVVSALKARGLRVYRVGGTDPYARTARVAELVDAGLLAAPDGDHVVVPRDRIDSSTGLILRTESSVLFCIPWGTHWIIGTTDTDWELSRAHPAATATDIDYLLEEVNSVLLTPLTREDIQGVYAGLRPLLAGESEETSQLSREHAVARPQPGLISIAGGKYTTYRVMGADAVDAAGERSEGAHV